MSRSKIALGWLPLFILVWAGVPLLASPYMSHGSDVRWIVAILRISFIIYVIFIVVKFQPPAWRWLGKHILTGLKRIRHGLLNIRRATFIQAWAFSAMLGAIYWALKESLVNVLFSLIIPGYGLLSMLVYLLAS